jgi:hypothetical protein
MKEIAVSNIHGNFSPSFSSFATGCLSWLLLESSGGWIKIIRTQMEKHNRLVMVAVYGTPCSIPARNTNSNSRYLRIKNILPPR